MLALIAAHGIAPGDILGIEVATFGRTLTLGNEVAPTTLEGAQYSLPFCLGVAAVGGASALLPLQGAALADAGARELARKVRMTVDPAFDAMFSAAVPGRVQVETSHGRFEPTVLMPKGEPANPMSWAEIEAKVDAVADGRVDAAMRDHLRRAVPALRSGDVTPVRSILATKALG